MKLLSIIMIHLKQAIFSWRFLACSLCVCAILLATVSGIFDKAFNVWYLLDMGLIGSGNLYITLCVLPILPYAISFAGEWESRAFSFWVVRCGVRKYTVSKIISSAVSGFGVVLVGIILFIVIMSLWFPLFTETHYNISYEALMEQSKVLYGISLYVIHVSLSGALAAACALWASVYIPNRFTTAVAPIVLHFTLIRLTLRTIDITNFLHPLYWIEGIYSVESPLATLSIKAATVGILICMMCVSACFKIKKRINRS